MSVKINCRATNYIRNNVRGDLIASAISEIVSIPESVRIGLARSAAKYESFIPEITSWTELLIQSRETGDVRISPNHFTDVGDPIPDLSADLITQQTPLGQNLLAKISELGVPQKIYGGMNAPNRRSYHRYLTLILAGLCMASSGANTLDTLGSGIVRRYLEFYYDDQNRRFHRDEMWGTRYNVAGKCLRKLAIAFGAYFGDSRLTQMGSQSRSAAHGSINYSELFENTPNYLIAWIEGWKDWRGTVRKTTDGGAPALQRFAAYLTELHLSGTDVSSPEVFLQQKHSPSFVHFVKNRRTSMGKPDLSLSVVAEVAKIRQFSIHMAELLKLKERGKPYYDIVPERQRLKLTDDLRRLGKGQRLGSAAEVVRFV